MTFYCQSKRFTIAGLSLHVYKYYVETLILYNEVTKEYVYNDPERQ